MSNSFNFSRVFKEFFNKNGYNFDDISKNGYFRPLNKSISTKGYDVIIYVLDVTNKVLSRDSSYVVDVVM